jgi:hypothetical protein
MRASRRFALSSPTRYQNEKPVVSGVAALKAFDSRRVDLIGARLLPLLLGDSAIIKNFPFL